MFNVYINPTTTPDATGVVVNSGSVASGSISRFAMASGAVNSGHVASGAIIGCEGVGRTIASGTIGFFDLANNAVQRLSIASGAVISGGVASGQIGFGHLADASVQATTLASGAVISGIIASGQVGFRHLANDAVQSGSIASGAVAKEHTASGLLQASLQFIIDGGGTALASGEKGDIIVPFNCKINYINIFSDQSGGSIFPGIWRDSYANYPPTSGDTIAPSGVPLISGAIRNSYSGTAALSGWTTSLTKGDVLKFVVYSGLTMTRTTIAMQVGVGD